MLTSLLRNRALPALIAGLAAVDGILHLQLDMMFFGGNVLANQLSVLFALNFAGFVGLAVLFLLARRVFGDRWWLADMLLSSFTGATVIAWVNHGSPNPAGLGTLVLWIEVVLLGGLAIHMKDAWMRWRLRPHMGTPAAA